MLAEVQYEGYPEYKHLEDSDIQDTHKISLVSFVSILNIKIFKMFIFGLTFVLYFLKLSGGIGLLCLLQS